VEELDLALDGRLGDGRRLQAVAQSLVVEVILRPGSAVAGETLFQS
jgi:hypothetical protein